MLIEHPRNWAACQGLMRLRSLGARLVLMSRKRAGYAVAPWLDVSPLSLFDRVEEADTNDVGVLVARIAALRMQVAAVMSFSHHFCATAAAVARRLGLSAPPPDSIDMAVNKDRLRSVMGSSQFSVRWAVAGSESKLREAIDEVGLPLVIKPLSGASSTDVVLARTADQATKAFRRINAQTINRMGQPLSGGALLEEYVEGPEFSVEAMTVGCVTSAYGVTSKLPHPAHHFIEQADTFHGIASETDAAVTAAATAALTMMVCFSGPSHTEIRYGPTGPKIIEVNPRQGGGYLPTLIEVVTGRNIFVDAVAERLELSQPNVLDEQTTPAATWWQFYSPSDGILREFGRPSPTTREAVVLFHPYARLGEAVQAPTDNRSCIGALIAHGHSPQDALAAARRAAATIRLVVESGPA